MDCEKRKDVLVRAGRTFWQAMLAYLLADATMLRTALTDFGSGKRALLILFVGAVAAGLSAVYNGVFVPMLRGERHGE